jgi:hypothetical protein
MASVHNWFHTKYFEYLEEIVDYLVGQKNFEGGRSFPEVLNEFIYAKTDEKILNEMLKGISHIEEKLKFIKETAEKEHDIAVFRKDRKIRQEKLDKKLAKKNKKD